VAEANDDEIGSLNRINRQVLAQRILERLKLARLFGRELFHAQLRVFDDGDAARGLLRRGGGRLLARDDAAQSDDYPRTAIAAEE
jgi:hypothetical protein